MSSAQLDPRHHLQEEEDLNLDAVPFALQEPTSLKEQVAARLAAHRARRQRGTPAPNAPIPISSPSRARAARIAAAVAERYAHSESYRSFLTAHAESAIRDAEAAAEVAALNAQAITEAQLSLLEELDTYQQDKAQASSVQKVSTPEVSPASDLAFTLTPPPLEDPLPALAITYDAVPAPAPAPDPLKVTVRLYEDVAPAVPERLTTSHLRINSDPLDEEGLALDEEIAFRQSPTFEEPVAPTEIPANLIQFPRQLVAARRARPRLAEGPLREDADSSQPAPQDSAQLRIFEVEATQISPAPAVDTAAPEWASIMLDAQPVFESYDEVPSYLAADTYAPAGTYPAPERYQAPLMVQAQEPTTVAVAAPLFLTASLELRVMAAAVDTCIVLAALLAFATAAVLTIGVPSATSMSHLVAVAAPASAPARYLAMVTHFLPYAAAAVVIFLVLTALYQLLFFTFSVSTPGMNYARIGLCTFSDENPTRSQLRRRVLHSLLATCPLGLGILWSWVDTDRLGWHDRLSRTYQRSY